MSVNSMVNIAIARRTDIGSGKPAGLRSHRDIQRASAGTDQTETPGASALAAIVAYIPTEVIILYVAALAAVRAKDLPSGTSARVTASVVSSASSAELLTFIIFLIITPVIVWLLFAGKVKAAGKLIPASPSKWPVWEMSAAIVAFAAWAYALPDSPFSRFSWYTVALGTLVVLVVSTALGLLAPIVQRPLKP